MHIQESTLRHLRWPSSLSREENVSHAFVNQILHSYALQEENILLHTFPNSIGICRQQTKFAAFILSLQNGKRAACSTLVPYCALFLFIRKHSISPLQSRSFYTVSKIHSGFLWATRSSLPGLLPTSIFTAQICLYYKNAGSA